MITTNNLDYGFTDAENYKNKNNKEFLNEIFVKDIYLDEIIKQEISFLIGEKGTGKTAYAVYLSNNNYKENQANIKYIRETDYTKFISLKKQNHLSLSDYSSIWKVILLLLFSHQIQEKEGIISKLFNFEKFNILKDAINEYYYSAFSPEIIQAISFIENSEIAAELLSKHANLKGATKETISYQKTDFQRNLFYIEKNLKKAYLN